MLYVCICASYFLLHLVKLIHIHMCSYGSLVVIAVWYSLSHSFPIDSLFLLLQKVLLWTFSYISLDAGYKNFCRLYIPSIVGDAHLNFSSHWSFGSFHENCTNLCSYQQHLTILLSQQHLLLVQQFDFLNVCLTSWLWNQTSHCIWP